MESSSLERRDESEESRSGGTQDRPGRDGRRAARPMTPPHRPPPPSTSPRSSPRLSQPSAAGDLWRLPLSAKSIGGRPTLGRSVEMSAGDTRAGHHGAHRTMDGRVRAGGPGRGYLRRPS